MVWKIEFALGKLKGYSPGDVKVVRNICGHTIIKVMISLF